MDTFWLVWREFTTSPTHKHGTEASARREAERLARANPGEEFFILAAIDSCVAPLQPVTWQSRNDEGRGVARLEDHDAPF